LSTLVKDDYGGIDSFSKEAGLNLLLDYNKERSLNVKNMGERQAQDDNNSKDSFDMRVLTDMKKTSATIFIHNIAQFKGSGPGSYVITAVKEMVGTEAFLDLPDKKKRCQQEFFKQCVEKNLLMQAKERCGCLPWTLGLGVLSGVSFSY
jgi:hypothetical protein